ncbi:protein translocase subunit SecD [Pokkaliibacter sp. CJK22405]|uniref:protein translocase subunit SecD n=1 Tax=Pokkaliibacter sp. CJK22405 TaxID=3384615 RepID=UPI0039854670
MKSLRTRAVVYGLVIVLGLLSALPNLLPLSLSQSLPGWYTHTKLALGLDLEGGSHLLLAADTQALTNEQLHTAADELTSSLKDARIHYQRPRYQGARLLLDLRDPGQIPQAATLARQRWAATSDGVSHYDLTTSATGLEVRLDEGWQQRLLSDAIERSLEVVRRRLNESGLVEPSITKQGTDSILVQMPGVADPTEIKKLLGTTAKMTFHWVARGDANEPTMEVKSTDGQSVLHLEQRVAMQGKHIADAHQGFQANTGEPVVNFRLDGTGARQFGDITRANIGRALAIVLDGKVITAPVIRDAIGGGSGEISGSFTPQSANELALLLRAGALPVPLHVVEERTVGPDLGSDAISMGVYTGLIGAALVVLFMLAIYGVWGLIACIGLGINIALVFGLLSVFGATLTLPGIAGVILTLGMAVDANILINERIREESVKGKSATSALREGFDKAYSTILDSNLTTLIAVSLLFMFGSGPVKGFAVTIGIGLLTSMFTAIAVTRLLMEWRVQRHPRRPLSISGVSWLEKIGGRSIDFLRRRVIGLAASAILSTLSVVLFFTPGLHYGVDFTGGTVIEVTAPHLSLEQLRASFDKAHLAEVNLQEFGGPGHYLVRTTSQMRTSGDSEANTEVSAIKSAVQSADAEASFPRVDMVGPKVSGDFSDLTVLAILAAGAGMLLYLWVRFESHFALAATLTIALDLTKTIGFFALTGVEFNLTAVAALLALIGYSINDKVVVFDRIRENLRATPDRPILDLLNVSISSTLNRTIFTSTTTFLALLPMGIAGGAAVSSFALPMLFGIVIGTSSSIFIAAPLLSYLSERRTRKGIPQLRPTRAELQQQLDLMP